jgi:D-glycero-D-manno-heptose 1,7-bisphosphate phosphatase
MKHYALVVLDVDGTLTTTKSGARVRKNAADWQWLPGRLQKLHELEREGVKIAIATNQAGVAFGYLPQQALHAELEHMLREANLPPDALYVCYTHPKATLPQFLEAENEACRKPHPGMLLEAMQHFGVPPAETLYVGDRPVDEETARNAGIDYMPASAFFHSDVS